MFLSAAQPLDIYTPGFVPTVIAYVCDWSPVLLEPRCSYMQGGADDSCEGYFTSCILALENSPRAGALNESRNQRRNLGLCTESASCDLLLRLGYVSAGTL